MSYPCWQLHGMFSGKCLKFFSTNLQNARTLPWKRWLRSKLGIWKSVHSCLHSMMKSVLKTEIQKSSGENVEVEGAACKLILTCSKAVHILDTCYPLSVEPDRDSFKKTLGTGKLYLKTVWDKNKTDNTVYIFQERINVWKLTLEFNQNNRNMYYVCLKAWAFSNCFHTCVYSWKKLVLSCLYKIFCS